MTGVIKLVSAYVYGDISFMVSVLCIRYHLGGINSRRRHHLAGIWYISAYIILVVSYPVRTVSSWRYL